MYEIKHTRSGHVFELREREVQDQIQAGELSSYWRSAA